MVSLQSLLLRRHSCAFNRCVVRWCSQLCVKSWFAVGCVQSVGCRRLVCSRLCAQLVCSRLVCMLFACNCLVCIPLVRCRRCGVEWRAVVWRAIGCVQWLCAVFGVPLVGVWSFVVVTWQCVTIKYCDTLALGFSHMVAVRPTVISDQIRSTQI